MPRARCRRTVLRSSPTLRAMAETVSPCRFKSWIKTISPSVTTCAPLRLLGRAGGAWPLSPIPGKACLRRPTPRRSDLGSFQPAHLGRIRSAPTQRRLDVLAVDAAVLLVADAAAVIDDA